MSSGEQGGTATGVGQDCAEKGDIECDSSSSGDAAGGGDSGGFAAPSADGVVGDTPFHRRLFSELTLAEQEAFLDGLRERRLASVRAFEQMQEIKQRAKDEQTRAQIDKELRMMDKELSTLARAMDKVDKRRLKLDALRLLVENRV